MGTHTEVDIASLLEWFDVKEYLDARGVFHNDEPGKNIQEGWIAINCLWCDDPSTHLGIDLNNKGINCWRCPTKGTVIKLIMKIDRCSFDSALLQLEKFSHISASIKTRSSRPEQMPEVPIKVELPPLSQNELLQIHHDYLLSRNFDPFRIFKKYRLNCMGPVGEFIFRLIIPFYEKGRLVTYTTRDVTNKSKIPYIHCDKKSSILHPKDTLYNIDTVEDTAVVVEGVTDVWRMGDGVIATMGDKWTAIQARLLAKRRGVKRCFILYDTEEEAQENAKRLAFYLSTSIQDVNLLELNQGDPGALSPDDAKSIRKEIFGRIY